MRAICGISLVFGWLVIARASRTNLWNRTVKVSRLRNSQPRTVSDLILRSQLKAAASSSIAGNSPRVDSSLLLVLSSRAPRNGATSAVNRIAHSVSARRHRRVGPRAIRMRADNTSLHALPELVGFPGLKAGDFQDPRDKVATAQLSAFVPIELALRNLLLPFLEEASFFDNIGRGVQVSKEQYPTIHRLVVEAAAQLDISVPDVFVKSDPRPNAYTLAFQGKRPFIVLHTSLIDLMTLEEVKAVIGHELGHLKCEHSLWITVLNILALGVEAVEVLVPLGLRQLISRQLTQWRRSAELSCDRASLLVSRNESVVMSVLMKLTGGSAKLAGEMSAEEFAQQAKDYDDATQASWFGRLVRSQDESQLYPLPILRAREIQKYAQSKDYKDLQSRLASNIPM